MKGVMGDRRREVREGKVDLTSERERNGIAVRNPNTMVGTLCGGEEWSGASA